MDHKTCLLPCRTCGCPLYLEEALSRHNAEDHVIEIKEWHCLHCNKSFHRDGNKILYRRNYEHGARSLSSAAAKIEGICYKKGKRNGKRNRNVTLASGEYLEYWKAPKSIELSLKQATMVYQKSFDEANKRELVDRLKNTLEQHRNIICGMVLSAKDPLKWYLSLKLEAAVKQLMRQLKQIPQWHLIQKCFDFFC